MTSFTPLPTPKPVGGKILIYDFTLLDASGEPIWYIVGVAPARAEEFVAILRQPNTNVDLSLYGKILASGNGSQIPESVRQEIYKKYSVSTA